MLPSDLQTALGLPDTATPAQALEKLRQMAATAQTQAAKGLKTTTGTYAGTNATTKTIVLPNNPKLLIVAEHPYQNSIKANGKIGVMFYPYTVILFGDIGGFFTSLIYVCSWSGNTVTLRNGQYSTNPAPLNGDGYNYNYFVIYED